MRIFNTYGPKMSPDDGSVVSNFIVQALRGENLTIYGDGSQTRSFCYVDDLVNGMQSLMESKLIGPVNIGNDEEYTIYELAQVIIKKSTQSLKLYSSLCPKMIHIKRKPFLEIAKKELNWSPEIRLNEGLDRTIDYFRSLEIT